MAYSPSNQYLSIQFLQWSKFLWKKNLRYFYFVGTYFCGSRKKPAKIAKNRTRKNLVPHGRWFNSASLEGGVVFISKQNAQNRAGGGVLAATFDLAAFGLYMIAPVKKSVNHLKTVTNMRDMRVACAN